MQRRQSKRFWGHRHPQKSQGLRGGYISLIYGGDLWRKYTAVNVLGQLPVTSVQKYRKKQTLNIYI